MLAHRHGGEAELARQRIGGDRAVALHEIEDGTKVHEDGFIQWSDGSEVKTHSVDLDFEVYPGTKRFSTGTWYLQDRVIVAEFDFMLIGAGFYHDRYRRTADGWRISATGYDRTYDATMSLKNLDFKITPGIALA